MGTRCAIYLRVSLDATGEMLAVQRQREDCYALAEARGWEVVGEFVDNSISASDARKQRPGYDALVRAFHAGEFDALVAWDLDRLTRQPRQLEDWIDAATENGLLLVTANGEADLGTDGGRMFARIKSSVARAEIERKGARQRRALRQRAERGRPPLGPRLTGYTSDGRVIPAEAGVIATMFSAFAAGESLKSLAAQLQDSGVPTRRGGRWSPSSVRTMLTNPRYAGHAIYGGEQIDAEATWKPIVSGDVFALVQARLHDPRRATNREGTDRKHLGSGLYRCQCGRAVQSWSGSRYRCKAGCITRSMPVIDDYVLGVVRARLAQPDLRDLLTPADADESVKQLTAEAERLRDRRRRIESDYDNDLIDGRRYRVATEKVDSELVSVDRQIAARSTVSGAGSLLTAPDPVAAFDAASLMRKRAVLDALCVVTLSRAPRGSRTFDPATVTVEWRTS